jgi:hypothetical protein
MFCARVKEFGSHPVEALLGHGQKKPERQEIARLRREVNRSTSSGLNGISAIPSPSRPLLNHPSNLATAHAMILGECAARLEAEAIAASARSSTEALISYLKGGGGSACSCDLVMVVKKKY